MGDLDLHYEVLHQPDSNGQRLLTHTAAVGRAAADVLALLGLGREADYSGPKYNTAVRMIYGG